MVTSHNRCLVIKLPSSSRRSKYINNSRKYIYSLYLNRDGSFNLKHENTYDEDGNLLTTTHYIYDNGNWVVQ